MCVDFAKFFFTPLYSNVKLGIGIGLNLNKGRLGDESQKATAKAKFQSVEKREFNINFLF